jgi:hypothetical protein
MGSLLAGVLFVSCADQGKDRGGLMLAVSSDGPLPIDHLELHVASQGETLHSRNYDVPGDASLPTTIAIASNGDETASVEITVVGWSEDGTLPLDRRDAIVLQVPTDRVAMLPIVLSARCSPKVMAVDGEAISSCGEGSTCDPRTGDCESSTIDAKDLPTYTAGAETMVGVGGADGGGSAGMSSEGGAPGSGTGGETTGLGGQPDAMPGGSPGSGAMSNSAGAGSGGLAGAVGTGGEGGPGCQATTEICDGLDNDCDDTPDQGATCPAGCVAQQHDGHVYAFCSTSLSWSNARGECQGIGLDLVTIASPAEASYVQSQVTLPIWIGASDVATEGDWLWPDGTPQAGSYDGWASGQPSGQAGSNCAVWESGGWNDVTCTVSHPFVCRDP